MSGILRSAGAVTLLSLLLRLASIFTQSHMAENLGAEGLGLLQLAMSVQALAVTLAMSGIRYSATRLIAQELGLGRCQRVRRVTRACALYALGFNSFPESSIKSVKDGMATVTMETGLDTVIPCDVIVNAADMLPNTGLLEGISVKETYTIGDCANPFNIALAIRGGNDAGRAV